MGYINYQYLKCGGDCLEDNEDYWIKKIKEKIQDALKSGSLKEFSENVKVESKVNVLKDITIIKYEKDGFKIVFGDAEQDIVIYLNDDKFKINIPEAEDFKKASGSFPTSGRTGSHKPHIIIPLIIFEVKLGANSHQITCCSSIAEQIKDKFPFVTYNLLLLESAESGYKQDETLERHGKRFNRIIRWKEIGEESINKIAKELEKIIAQDLDNLRKRELF